MNRKKKKKDYNDRAAGIVVDFVMRQFSRFEF